MPKILEANVSEGAVQYVRTTVARTSEGGQTLALPGTLQGFQQAPLAARSAGYLKRWTKDIGSHVAKGELLADIETPEIDQQLSQADRGARPDGGEPRAREEHGRALGSAAQEGRVSQQELDERRSGLTQARANLAAADANVERLRQLQGFKRVTAPFAGVITQRNVDVGDLIDAGGGGGRALFVLTQIDPLRVYVNVPQSYAQLVRPGQKVDGHAVGAARPDVRRRGRAHAASIDAGDAHDAGRDRAAEQGRRRCCPAPTCRSRCRWRAAARSSCRPTRCCSAARARASPSSTPRTGST